MDEESSVVELAIVIDHPTAQTLRLEGWEKPSHLCGGDHPRAGEPALDGQQVVCLQPEGVEGHIAAAVARKNEWQVMDKVGSVSQESATLSEGSQHEPDVSLAEIADPTVDEFRTSAGRPPTEITPLKQEHLIPTSGSVDRYTGSSRPAPDHHHIPRVAAVNRPLEHVGAVHLESIESE
jgi:hypothetical protein